MGDGSFNVSLTYSKFGKDQADSTSFATGDRALAQAALAVPMGSGSDLLLSAWDLYRGVGQQLGASSPWENVGNAGVAIGFQMGDLYVQPNIEERIWNVDGNKAGLAHERGRAPAFRLGRAQRESERDVFVRFALHRRRAGDGCTGSRRC